MSNRAKSELAVVILAAGQGTRMKSTTPKVLHPIAGRSLVAHVLDTAQSLKADHVVAVVRHERDLVSAAILDHAPETVIVDQDETPGTGRAVEQAVAALPENFKGSVVVLSGDVPLIDVPTLKDLIDSHVTDDRQMTILSAVFENPTGLGRIMRNETGHMTGIVEEKDATPDQRKITEINGGIYVFAREPLQNALSSIGTDNAQGEKYLTDAAAKILESGGKVDAVSTSDQWLIAGVNDRAQLTAAAKEFNIRTVRRHQMNGVTIWDPETTWIDAEVSIESDVVILPGTYLQGATSINSGAIIGPDTTLVDSEVLEGATVKRSEANLAVIGKGATVGPFTYLRPGTKIGADGKVGAFVEAKNARIGDRSKVPHLSYVGDIVVGTDANIGAGTIVANYDGINKHETVIGDGARVGSNNVLISPVKIGDGAYTGAGSAIRRDVPPGALGVGMQKQRNLDDWVTENRPGTSSAEAAKKAKDGK